MTEFCIARDKHDSDQYHLYAIHKRDVFGLLGTAKVDAPQYLVGSFHVDGLRDILGPDDGPALSNLEYAQFPVRVKLRGSLGDSL